MKKIASNRNYRLIKKAGQPDWIAASIYNCLRRADPELNDSNTELQSGNAEVIIEKEGVKYKIVVTEERGDAGTTADPAPVEDPAPPGNVWGDN
jgi:hypothetical protein